MGDVQLAEVPIQGHLCVQAANHELVAQLVCELLDGNVRQHSVEVDSHAAVRLIVRTGPTDVGEISEPTRLVRCSQVIVELVDDGADDVLQGVRSRVVRLM